MHGWPRGDMHHVAATMFYIEAAVKIRDSQNVTQVPAYWKLSASLEKATYSELRHIDFTSAAGLKKQFEDKLEVSDQTNIPVLKTPGKKKFDPPSSARLCSFMKSLSECKSKPVVLSLIPPYSDIYVPDVLKGDLPPVLTEVRNDSAFQLNYTELLQKAKGIELTVSKQQADHVEAITREQTSNRPQSTVTGTAVPVSVWESDSLTTESHLPYKRSKAVRTFG